MKFRSWILSILAVGLLAVVVGGLSAGNTSAWQSTPTPSLSDGSPGGMTLAMVEQTIVPTRDRIDLAKRLLGITDIPQPPTTPPPEYNIGDELTFWADDLDADEGFQLTARLVYKTDHVYMFVEDGYDVDPADIKRSADTFENVIRPKVHEIFGSEWYPGIDGDPHLYILHAASLGSWVAAYYGSSSQYPVEAVSNSNQHEMFFVNLDTMAYSIGTDYYEAVLAHEFQHMVHWNVDLNEDTWLNEGLSELSAMTTGYGVSSFAPVFLSTPGVQLNNWPEDDNRGVHYGAAFMFVAYFYQRYGEAATTTLVSDPANGLESVSDTLAALDAKDPTTGQPVTLEDLFGDWLVANLLQDPSVGDGRYAYNLDDMAALPKARITSTLAADGQLYNADAPQWGAHYLQVEGGPTEQRMRFTFKGNDTVSIVPVDAHSGQSMWWGNRADESDTRLTHAFDLTGLDSATLNYWTWYYIENLWDYGYVMVSTNNGTTWTPLSTSHTTTDDPHSNGYGPGYTGQSGEWIQESVDLTPYAGQQILVRFEYITDDATTQPGMLIDDVSIPELGYSDDFESGAGDWVSEGWIWMDNVLPQYFLVQVVQPGNPDAPVTRWLASGDAPQGEWEFTVGGEMDDAVIVVSGLAPITTEPASYRYLLAPVP